LESHNFDVKLSDGKALFCELCTLGKQYTIPSDKSQPREEVMLDRIHINIAGGGATLPPAIAQAIEDSEFDYKDASQPSVRGARYFMLITDGYSRYRWFYTLKHKSDALQVLIDWITKMRTQYGLTPKKIRINKNEE
jgi:hypothetical protein